MAHSLRYSGYFGMTLACSYMVRLLVAASYYTLAYDYAC